LQSKDHEVANLKADMEQKTDVISALEQRSQQSTEGSCLLVINVYRLILWFLLQLTRGRNLYVIDAPLILCDFNFHSSFYFLS